MTLPSSESIPPEPEPTMPPARRRRQRRSLLPPNATGRTELLEELAHRSIPSAEFFLFSLFAGVILGLAILLDSPALYLLAALIAPFLAPVIGFALASLAGSFRYFLQILGGMALGILFPFLGGLAAGWIAPSMPVHIYDQALLHASFTWPDFLLVTIGAGLTTYMLVRSPHSRPLVASVALAYEIFLPAAVAGFGLSTGNGGLWPAALALFAMHLAWAVLIGTLVLFLAGLRPVTPFGYTLGTSIGLVSLAVLISLSGIGQAVTDRIGLFPPTPSLTPTQAPTYTPTLTLTPSLTPTITQTPTPTLVPTNTPTITLTPSPTPIYAVINGGALRGALVRAEPDPNAKIVIDLDNGTLVEILQDTVNKAGVIWVKVRVPQAGKEGWIISTVLASPTPTP